MCIGSNISTMCVCVLIMIGANVSSRRLGRYGLKAMAMLDTQTAVPNRQRTAQSTAHTAQKCSQCECVCVCGYTLCAGPPGPSDPVGLVESSRVEVVLYAFGLGIFGVLCIFNVCLLSLCRSLLFFSLYLSVYLSLSLSLPFSLSVCPCCCRNVDASCITRTL